MEYNKKPNIDSHFSSVDNALDNRGAGTSYSRKGSFSDFLTKITPDAYPKQNSIVNKTFDKKSYSNSNYYARLDYRIEDYLPRRKRIPRSTFDTEPGPSEIKELMEYSKQQQSTHNVPQQLPTARFAQPQQLDMRLQYTTVAASQTQNSGNVSLHNDETTTTTQRGDSQAELAAQAQKIAKLQQMISILMIQKATSNCNKQQPIRSLGWGPRITIQVMPLNVPKETQYIQTDSSSSTEKAISLAIPIPQPPQSQETQADIQAVATSRLPLRTDRTKTGRSMVATPKISATATNNKQNNRAIMNQQQASRQYRIRKEFMQLYPVKYSDTDSIVRTLLSYDD